MRRTRHNDPYGFDSLPRAREARGRYRDTSARPVGDEARALISCEPVYLDTETTGLGAWDEIVEICILDAAGAVLVESLVRPRIQIPREVIRIHGITPEMVRDAPTWAELWPNVHQTLDGRMIAVYNADFDLRLMKQSHASHRLAWPLRDDRFFCIMRLYARFFGEWNHAYGSYRWQKLENARHQCGLELPNAHRARADALLARAVLHYMARESGQM